MSDNPSEDPHEHQNMNYLYLPTVNSEAQRKRVGSFRKTHSHDQNIKDPKNKKSEIDEYLLDDDAEMDDESIEVSFPHLIF